MIALVFSLLLLLLLGFTDCKEPFYLGGIFPLIETDGSVDTSGNSRLSFFLLAVEHINNKTDGIADGILPNVNILTSVGDSKRSSHYGFLSAYYMLTEAFDGNLTQAIVGASYSSVTSSILSMTSTFDVPVISYASTSNDLSQTSSFPYFLRTCASDRVSMKGLADLTDAFEWDRVGIITSATTYGMGGSAYLIQYLENYGIAVEAFQAFETGRTDFSDIFNIMRREHITIVLFIAHTSDAKSFFLSAHQNNFMYADGVKRQLIVTDPSVSSSVLTSLEDNGLSNSDIKRLLKGTLGLVPYTPSTDMLEEVYAEWQGQEATIRPDGHCLSTTDDDGYFTLYGQDIDNNSTTPEVCCGVNFTDYSNESSSVETFSPFAYDAVMAVAYALDDILSETGYTMKPSEVSGPDLYDALVSLTFNGTTGNVTFDTNGDRQNAYFTIKNFNEALFDDGEALPYSIVGYWNDVEDGFVICDQSVDAGNVNKKGDVSDACIDWRGGKIPSDSMSEKEEVPILYQISFLIFSFLIIVFSIFFGVTVYIHRQDKVMKVAQPRILVIILFGAIVGGVAMAAGAFMHESDFYCTSFLWTSHLSFIIVISGLIAKNWRVARIFNMSKLKKVKLEDTTLMKLIFAATCAWALYLGAWTFFFPPGLQEFSTFQDGGYREYQEYCNFTSDVLSALLNTLEACSLGVAMRLAWVTRRSPGAFNESKYIAMILQVFAILFFIIVPGVYLMWESNRYLARFMQGMGFFAQLIWGICILILPKIYILHSHAELGSDFEFKYTSRGGNGFKGKKDAVNEGIRSSQFRESMRDSLLDLIEVDDRPIAEQMQSWHQVRELATIEMTKLHDMVKSMEELASGPGMQETELNEIQVNPILGLYQDQEP
jgi:ABC-type branched-subunit amino acid transport system substrate-binding protein